MSRSFGVDLRGIIELLSQHLYSSPRVYVRELLQNALDAVTARGDVAARIEIETAEQTGDGTLRISDNGIGLTEDEVHSLLSTLGRTSKRDELGFARQDFLGQFGVGLLSCFLVADEIQLVSRSAKGGPAVRWIAHADGTYEVTADDGARAEIGTTVTLIPRRDAEHWVQQVMVTELAKEFGELLPAEILIGEDRLTLADLPWSRRSADFEDRLSRYCEQTFGFRPFAVVPLDVPTVGLTGVAFVMAEAAHPGSRQAHRIYLKRMLVGDSVEGLLPDWAYFVRCVVNSSALRPTASREALYQDETLLAIRDELGGVLKDWLVRLGATEPDRASALLAAHQLGMKSVALVDDELLRLVERWLPFETTDGDMTLRQFRRRYASVLYTANVDEFRQLRPIAEAQGLGLLNAGYAYDAQLMQRLVDVDGVSAARQVKPSELLATMDEPDPKIEQDLDKSLTLAQPVLDRHDCEAIPRAFDPVSLPALLITDADRERQLDAEKIGEDSDPLWAELLGQLSPPASTASQQLVLNTRNPLVRRLSELTDPALAELTVESLYVHALLQSRRPMRPKDTAALNRSFLDLLDRAVRG